ncbi:polysaccharide deacetylase family protein [Mycobacterium asiaticum]|uniref:Polysaccharide deacetylase n=1 Tax=Mycobacterium asiaticum TaxID=1790 RepID=A0A1A3CXF3_MYCAS|nr:polysaccharide deacetylase family protein [Mycobacterium asiaticum]OBI91062.1 polysaccharide deacetylase [Mycobacterium asiaticum]OBJ56107.1 polysaccharide deacetylase [Mycobacterium asiaticum]OBJ82142.1 polysaccharide deacetylase [Mycobacterium asiaticum]ORA14810.1 polysaccharide deacetylase [Mycobacterium asiaticum DSM 44297]
MSRRRFLGSLAISTVASVGLARCMVDPQPRTFAQTPAAELAPPAGPTVAGLLPPPPPSTRVRLPGGGVLSQLPGNGDLLALTVDDGTNSEVVRAYTQFAKDTGIRLTFFVNGTYDSWTDNLAMLRPLVESGQIELGNHTWSHPDLTTLPKGEIAKQLMRNDEFLKKTYGVGAKPYWRPPYAKHNAEVDSVAADLGYSLPVLWSGSLSDSTLITEEYIVKMADQYFTPQAIVIGHLNHLPVTHVYPQLVEIIRDRKLRTVTFNDVFLKTP